MVIGMAVAAAITAVAALLMMLGYIGKSKVDKLQSMAEAGQPQAQFKLGLCYYGER